ncbi:MAG: chemotaxis protein CheW [Rhodobacteraceae bacterium]|nr:purine-binding chemotaxis protein CheW [Paracoccaceae bacterium]MCZ8152584.1 chemotaxis protein CheW [Paracoccaceae bacterium]MCZ8334312.1 chemotaxis protein CheW [Paracoccaceae bacterium]
MPRTAPKDAIAETQALTLLVFGLAGETFALPVTTIHEVIDPLPVTPVPNAAPHAPGLINVRGIVTPMLDVRLRLRMPPAATAEATRFIVLELLVSGIRSRIAIEADAVREVVEVDPTRLEPVPELGARWPAAFVRGVARHDDMLVVLLDPDTLFAPDADRPAPNA